MTSIQKLLPPVIRIIIALLFLVSAAAKLYPSPYFAITTFEVKQLYPLGFSESLAPFFSRILIGIEFALGFLLLINYYLKRITIPATLLMLAVFTIHLTIVTFVNGGNSGNCGCFGSLLPMTPIEAILKNVVAMALLLLLLWLTKKQSFPNTHFWLLTTITFASILAVFMVTFSQPKAAEQPFTVTDLSTKVVDIEPAQPLISEPAAVVATTTAIAAKTQPKTEVVAAQQFQSGYQKYFPSIDKGEKMLCFFVPGCPHCAEVATELTALKAKNKNFPEISILFMDEEADLIPEFFTKAGATYNYKIIDIIGFWKVLGTGKDVPGVKLLRNGKTIKYYFGTTDNKFVASDLIQNLEQ